MRRRIPALLALAASLAACPEERPGSQRQVPVQRVPPAVSVEAADAGPPLPAPQAASDAGATPR